MSTSGTTSYSLTNLEIIEKAFHRLGKASEGESLTDRMYSDGKSSLNLILKRMGTNEHLWLKTERSVTLIASTASYALTPKPMRIISVRRRNTDSTIDTPMAQISRQEYYDLPNKTTSPTIPVSWYYDPQLSTGTLYVWPAPSSTTADDYTLELTYLRKIEDMTNTGNDLDMPQEWLDAIVWQLADDLETEYPVNDTRLAEKIERKAAQSLSALESFDTELTSIYFEPEPDYYAGSN